MDVIVVFHFGIFFALLAPSSPKNENFKTIKNKFLEISSFNTSVPKIIIICYNVPEIWCVTDVIVVFHFGLYFAPLAPKSPKNEYFETKQKNPGDIIILHKCTKNHDHMLYCS